MHTNEACGGRRLCAWVEIEMHFQNSHSTRMARQGQGHGKQWTMLCNAHHFGLHNDVVVQLSISKLAEIESKESRFQAIFAPQK